MTGNAWLDSHGVNRSGRVTRAGSWYSLSKGIRSAKRDKQVLGLRAPNVGFRLALDL